MLAGLPPEIAEPVQPKMEQLRNSEPFAAGFKTGLTTAQLN